MFVLSGVCKLREGPERRLSLQRQLCEAEGRRRHRPPGTELDQRSLTWWWRAVGERHVTALWGWSFSLDLTCSREDTYLFSDVTLIFKKKWRWAVVTCCLMPVNANDFLWRRGALCRQRRLKHLNECLQTSRGSETLLLFLIECEERERLFLVTNDEESEGCLKK